MNKVIDSSKWLARNFFFISIGIFIIIYLRWFRLTPLMFYNDPDGAYIVGVILLGLFSLFAVLTRRSRKKVLLSILSIILLLGNIYHAMAFFPSVDFITMCNQKTYYITWMHPFGDYQWIFNNVTIWKNLFSYESFFLSYSSDSYEVICDEQNNEAHIVTSFTNRLAYTDSETPRNYSDGVRLGNYEYGLSYGYDENPNLFTYTIYECEPDFTNCDLIPFKHTGEYGEYSSFLISDEENSELSVYFYVYEGTKLEEILIFTYGKNPRCYVEGCEILEETK